MRIKDLQPPYSGAASNPVLYGVAAGLAALFPPVSEPERRDEEEAAIEEHDEGRESGRG